MGVAISRAVAIVSECRSFIVAMVEIEESGDETMSFEGMSSRSWVPARHRDRLGHLASVEGGAPSFWNLKAQRKYLVSNWGQQF